MHNIEVLLVLVAPDPQQPNDPRYLLGNTGGEYRLPGCYVGKDESTIQVAARMLDDLTGLQVRILNTGWVELVQVPIADDVGRMQYYVPPGDEVSPALARQVRTISVPYAGMLPGEVVPIKLEGYRWVRLSELMKNKNNVHLDHFDIAMISSQMV